MRRWESSYLSKRHEVTGHLVSFVPRLATHSSYRPSVIIASNPPAPTQDAILPTGPSSCLRHDAQPRSPRRGEARAVGALSEPAAGMALLSRQATGSWRRTTASGSGSRRSPEALLGCYAGRTETRPHCVCWAGQASPWQVVVRNHQNPVAHQSPLSRMIAGHHSPAAQAC
ncbi:hypothetical protein BJY52DRAFT_1281056 [Lactarius psammicola]|nr:hypothetical protein BJY52DRAFT_1281056 [Lactarius psammicola]